MTALLAIFANVFLLAAALGFGSLLRRLFPGDFSFLDRLAFVLLGGLGLQGVLLFCVGQLWFSGTLIVLVLVSGLALSLKSLIRPIPAARAALARISVPTIPAILIVVVLLITAIAGLAETTGDMNHDSIAYHYLGPTVWLRDKIIHPVPDEILTAFPVVTETQYAALLFLGGRRAPGLFSVTCLIALFLIAASLALRLGLDQSAAWWTAALLITMPAVYRGAYAGFVDVLFAAFVLAAARIGFAVERRRHYMLFGFFCGLSMAAKYTGIVCCFLLILTALLISLWTRRARPGRILQYLAIASASAIVVASPFYLRNWIVFACPIYPPPPILLGIFAVRDLPPAVLLELERNVRETGIGMGRGIGNFLLLPLRLTYHTANFRGAGGIGLVPLALAPFGFLTLRHNVFAKSLLLFVFLQTAVWFETAQVSRYLIPVYVIAALFGVAGWQYVAGAGSKVARVLCGLIVTISIGYGLLMIVSERRDDVRAALSSSFASQRRLRETRFIESFDYINAEPSVNKVLIADPYVAGYFSDKTYIKPMGRWGEQTLPDATNLQKILLTLPDLRVSHVLDVSWAPGGFRIPEHPAHLTLVFQREDQRIYRVDQSP